MTNPSGQQQANIWLFHQVGDWGLGGLQCLLWADRVAATLGELPAGVQQREAAPLSKQQALWRRPARGQADLQPVPLPRWLEDRALDHGEDMATGPCLTRFTSNS